MVVRKKKIEVPAAAHRGVSKFLKRKIWIGTFAISAALMALLAFAVNEDLKRPGANKVFQHR